MQPLGLASATLTTVIWLALSLLPARHHVRRPALASACAFRIHPRKWHLRLPQQPLCPPSLMALDHADLAVGQSVIAYGRSPNGEWTRFNAVDQAVRERAPHIVVKYTSDMQGNAIRICLPSPVTAYLSRSDIEVVES